ncbi:MAG TPA: DUF4369 domain-containing protein [Burkholderiaceae bacterium]|nr:DUF4369 domain-containing protein [Burkholderiaceae bacterium]
MNRTRVMAVVCSTVFTAMLSGCGGGNSANATIGGTLTNLAAGTTVSLTNNGGTPVTLSANGNFTFSGSVASNAGYNVVVSAQPTGQTCSVVYGSGTIDFSGTDVTNVAVNCVANTPIGVLVSNLGSGDSVTFTMTLQNDPSNTSTVTVTNGAINEFPVLLQVGALYSVAVTSQPGGNASPSQVCAATSAYAGGVVSSTPIVVDFNCQ